MSGLSLSLNQRNTQLRGKWSKGMAIDFGQTFSDLFVMCCYCSELRRKNSIPVAASLFLFLPHFSQSLPQTCDRGYTNTAWDVNHF